jgi:hypothetical protein
MHFQASELNERAWDFASLYSIAVYSSRITSPFFILHDICRFFIDELVGVWQTGMAINMNFHTDITFMLDLKEM